MTSPLAQAGQAIGEAIEGIAVTDPDDGSTLDSLNDITEAVAAGILASFGDSDHGIEVLSMEEFEELVESFDEEDENGDEPSAGEDGNDDAALSSVAFGAGRFGGQRLFVISRVEVFILDDFDEEDDVAEA